MPRIFLRAPIVLLAAFLFLSSAQAAENISAYVDAEGRVIFVNEGAKSPQGPTNSNSSRNVLASTTGSVAANQPAAPGAASLHSPQTASLPPAELDAMIEQAASRHQIDPHLIRAIIQVESNFNPYAVSSAGARGLMQLIPDTARRFGVANPFDPRANLDGGIRYLKHLLGLYEGDLRLTLAAYNAGENSVARYRGVPAYRETQNYIRKIGALYPIQNGLSGFRRVPQIMKFVDASGVIHFSNTDVPSPGASR